MTTEIIMPQAGQDIKKGRVVKWLKSEGDPVKKGQPICEVETEKVVFEVESPVDGVLLKIIIPDGEETEILSVIGIVGKPGEKVDLAAYVRGEKDEAIDISRIRKRIGKKEGGAAGKVMASGRARKLAAKKGIDLSALRGTGPGGRIVEKDILRAVDKRGIVKITPLARKIAQGHRLDLGIIKGSGSSGKIVKADVLRAMDANVESKRMADKSAIGAFKKVKEVKPLSGVRQVIFERMHKSLQETAQLTLTLEADASPLIEFRKGFNRKVKRADKKASFNAILIKILGQALKNHPGLNAGVLENEIWHWESVNIGLAMDAAHGLVVPVIRDADKKSIQAIQKETNAFVDKVKSKKLIPDDLQGGTFTLTNLGFLDIEAFTPILNPPESGILGVGKIVEKPVVEDGEIKVGQRMMLSLTIDHRIIDGADGARFLKEIKECIEDIHLLLRAMKQQT